MLRRRPLACSLVVALQLEVCFGPLVAFTAPRPIIVVNRQLVSGPANCAYCLGWAGTDGARQAWVWGCRLACVVFDRMGRYRRRPSGRRLLAYLLFPDLCWAFRVSLEFRRLVVSTGAPRRHAIPGHDGAEVVREEGAVKKT